MIDGKSLQAGTSHYFGQNFSKAFDIKFLDKDGTLKYGYTSSWGTSTRMIGAVIMAHGDERGLVFPPLIAPVQAIIIPVAAHKGGVNEKCEEIRASLKAAGIRAEIDSRDMSPGRKFNEWEMKGVPIRIEIGPRDIENGECSVFRRDTLEKFQMPLSSATEKVKELLSVIQKNMLVKSRERRDGKIVSADSLDGILKGVDGQNFVKAGWCGCRECEDKVKEYAQATARIMCDEEGVPEKCAICGKPAKHKVIFARAY